jgi:hypothetical protein
VNDVDTPGSPPGTGSQVPWFLAWTAVGAGVALVISAIGVFAVPLALLLAVFLLVRHHADRSAFGILVGMGMLSLYVAYVQRKGPGTVTWHTATASGSETYMDPRPWLVAGLLLVAIGIAAFLWRAGKDPVGAKNG